MNQLDEYQIGTKRTAGDDDIATLCLGLAGESGEVCDIVKKYLGHGHTFDKNKLISELGDVLWYVARLADSMGFLLSNVAESNIEKLRKRYPDGFSSERSIDRTQ